MAISAAEILGLMKEIGIEEEILKKLKNDVPFLSQGIDSIDLPTLAAATQKKYGVDLSNLDATKLKTLNDFVAYLNEKKQ